MSTLLTSTTGSERAPSAAGVAAAIASVGVTSPTAITALTTTLLGSDSGKTFLLAAATALTVNLPPPVAGLSFRFINTVAPSSVTHKIITDTTTTFLQGIIDTSATGAAASGFNGNGTTHRAVNFDGATKGGGIGTQVDFQCIDGTQWQVTGKALAVGSPATPFATS